MRALNIISSFDCYFHIRQFQDGETHLYIQQFVENQTISSIFQDYGEPEIKEPQQIVAAL